MYLCLYVFAKNVIDHIGNKEGKMNTNSTPFKKRENPLSKLTKPVETGVREKYTATMDKDLRKRIKIASAMKEVQVSTFIEDACREKLEREDL